MGLAQNKTKKHKTKTTDHAALQKVSNFFSIDDIFCSVALVDFRSYEMVDFSYFAHIFIVSVEKQGHRGPHSMISEVYL